MSNETAVLETPDQGTIAASNETPASYGNLLDAYDAIMAESGDSAETQQPDGTDDVDATNEDFVAPPEDGDTENLADGWDWKEFASNPVAVKVDGKEIEVPLEELRNGYMRQQDYTRKTQALSEQAKLAEWASDFQSRFQQNPEAIVRMLASAVGLDQSYSQQQNEPDPFSELLRSDPELQPVANMLQQQQQMISALSQQLEELSGQTGQTREQLERDKSIQAVKQEIDIVKQEFEDFDEMQILPVAAQTGLDLRSAYLMVKGQELVEGSRKVAVKPAAPVKKPAVSESKKKATGMVTNSRMSATPSTDGDQYDSFAELFEIVSRTEGA